MGSQFEDLLIETAQQVSATAATVEGAVRRMEELAKEHYNMRERIRALETGTELDTKHGEQEHDSLKARLKDGDEQFRKIQDTADKAIAEAREATREAGIANRAVDDLRGEIVNEKSLKSRIRDGWKRKIIIWVIGGSGFLVAKMIEVVLRKWGWVS
jgi:hypothetical protein